MNSIDSNVQLDTLESANEGTLEPPKAMLINRQMMRNKSAQNLAIAQSELLHQLITKDTSILSEMNSWEIVQEQDLISQEPEKDSNIKQFQKYSAYTYQKGKHAILPRIKSDIQIKKKAIYNLNSGPYYYHSSLLKALSLPEPLQDEIQKIYQLHFTQQLAQIQQKFSLSPQPVLKSKWIQLPPQKWPARKTLILDLDETLIHCNENLGQRADFFLQICIQFGLTIKAGVRVRPYLTEFLQQMSQIYELIVFTASHRIYAEAVLNKVDPGGQLITYLFSRESCIQDKGCFIKDLRIIKGRDISKLVIVDNSTMSFIYQLENGIPIIPFFSNDNDKELLHLSQFLKYQYSILYSSGISTLQQLPTYVKIQPNILNLTKS